MQCFNGDRDSLQLISDRTHILLATNKDTIEFGRKEFVEKYGVAPEQFVDVKALMGDSSDNIPGVLGIGEKTALKLISDFGSLDALYEQYMDSSLSASVKNKLSEGRENAFMSRTLATICREVPLETDLESIKNEGFSKAQLKALFEKFEFEAFIKRFDLDDCDEPQNNVPKKEIASLTLDFASALNFVKGKKIAVTFDENKCEVCDGSSVVSFAIESKKELVSIFEACSPIFFDCKSV